MRKRILGERKLSKKAKRVLASTLALSLALSGTAWAQSGKTTVKEEETKTYSQGDVNADGDITLDDAQIILRLALGIITPENDEQAEAADVDGNGDIDLTDAQLTLRAALRIDPLPSKEPKVTEVVTDAPTSVPTATSTVRTPPPSATPIVKEPKIILPPVEPKEENLVYGRNAEVLELNGAQQDGDTIVFGEKGNADEDDVLGVEMVNPYAGKKELRQTVADATRRVAKAGEVLVWELSGASIDKVPTGETDFEKLDKRIYDWAHYDPEVVYTKPEWTNGATVSFWVKTESELKADPILVFENAQFSMTIRMNGSVRTVDSMEPENFLDVQSTEIRGDYGEWTHYTVTIANDWVQVYVNGQENLYEYLEISRKKISKFNDGFLTRYNPTIIVNEEMVKADVRNYFKSSGAWYLNTTLDEPEWSFHDNFTAFGNSRYRGANAGSALIMNMLTNSDTKMWVGGAETSVGAKYTARQFNLGTNVSDIKYYEQELTAEQVVACYAYDTTTPTAIEFDPSITPTPATAKPTAEAGKFAIENKGNSATYDEETGIITFNEPNKEDETGAQGVRVTNPFANQAALKETIEDALSGQAIFPYLSLDDGLPVAAQVSPHTESKTGGGCDRSAIAMAQGNFYDVYYGDVFTYGSDMTPSTVVRNGDGVITSVKSEDELKELYKDQITAFHRPVWNKGASVSFWAKPTQVDDSPLISFHKPDVFLLVVSVEGDVCYYSLQSEDWGKGSVVSNGEPKNTFATLGDPSYVNEGEWNYYTITVANDWIQVYVNGKEMVYQKANLNNTETKHFNKGYLTRYNTIGVWTTDKVAKEGEPTGVTLEGTARNYLSKAGFIWNLSLPDSLNQRGEGNTGRDGGSIRATNAYENPFKQGKSLLMDNFTERKVEMYFGGLPTKLMINEKFGFSKMMVAEGTDPSRVVYEEKAFKVNDITGEVMDELTPGSFRKYYYTEHTLDAGTQVYGLATDNAELTAEQVAEKYSEAVQPN